jgi:pectin methylesterase-like acyl-CoA thioesterase
MLSLSFDTWTCRYVVYVKEGVYDELVTVTKKMVNLTMYGDGGLKSIITGNKNFVDGVRTFQTASFGMYISKPLIYTIYIYIYIYIYIVASCDSIFL